MVFLCIYEQKLFGDFFVVVEVSSLPVRANSSRHLARLSKITTMFCSNEWGIHWTHQYHYHKYNVPTIHLRNYDTEQTMGTLLFDVNYCRTIHHGLPDTVQLVQCSIGRATKVTKNFIRRSKTLKGHTKNNEAAGGTDGRSAQYNRPPRLQKRHCQTSTVPQMTNNSSPIAKRYLCAHRSQFLPTTSAPQAAHRGATKPSSRANSCANSCARCLDKSTDTLKSSTYCTVL